MYVVKKPYFGAQIRVNRGLYYHHGIYADDMHVIHFASSVPGHETDPAYARVEETTLEKFLKGGTLEVREYSDYEKKKLRSPEEIVSYAYKEIGRGGYNIVTNNCEHFSNECAFGEASSEQVNNVIAVLSRIFSR